jgi:hypothetical protein
MAIYTNYPEGVQNVNEVEISVISDPGICRLADSSQTANETENIGDAIGCHGIAMLSRGNFHKPALITAQ